MYVCMYVCTYARIGSLVFLMQLLCIFEHRYQSPYDSQERLYSGAFLQSLFPRLGLQAGTTPTVIGILEEGLGAIYGG